VVAVVYFAEWVNVQSFDLDNQCLYLSRSVIVFSGAIALCSNRTLLGYYQASVLAMTLCAYLLVEYDAGHGTNLIYDNYEAVIYGLVGCQFIGSFPTIWSACRDFFAGSGASVANILRSAAK
jgi:hypothetical protein